MPLGEGDGDPGPHQGALPWGERDVPRRDKVRTGVAGMGVGRQREIRVEPVYQHLQQAGSGLGAGPRVRHPAAGPFGLRPPGMRPLGVRSPGVRRGEVVRRGHEPLVVWRMRAATGDAPERGGTPK